MYRHTGLAVVMVTALLAIAPARAEETPKPKEQTAMKTLRYANAEDLVPVLSLLDVAKRIVPGQNILVLKGTPAALETALQIVDNLDVPAPSIAIKSHILIGSRAEPAEISVPDSVSAAAGQLQELFGYSRIHLLDTLFTRTTHHSRVKLEGGSPRGPAGDLEYSFEIADTRLIRGQEHLSVKLEGLHFESRLSPGDPSIQASLRTSVEVREGQMVVVGKARHKGSDEALILVMEVNVEKVDIEDGSAGR